MSRLFIILLAVVGSLMLIGKLASVFGGGDINSIAFMIAGIHVRYSVLIGAALAFLFNKSI